MHHFKLATDLGYMYSNSSVVQKNFDILEISDDSSDEILEMWENSYDDMVIMDDDLTIPKHGHKNPLKKPLN